MAKMVPVHELQPAFDNAIRHIHNRLSQARPRRHLSSMGQVANEFKAEFDCYALWDQNWAWETVGFKDDEQHMMFVLKWS